MPIKDKLWNFLYKGANADIKPAYLTAMGAGENYNDKWDPTTPEAQAAQKQLAETAALGAWTVAPEIMGPATFAHGAYDATKNGINLQNGLEMALSAAPVLHRVKQAATAISETPAFVGKANAISNAVRHQLDNAVNTANLPNSYRYVESQYAPGYGIAPDMRISTLRDLPTGKQVGTSTMDIVPGKPSYVSWVDKMGNAKKVSRDLYSAEILKNHEGVRSGDRLLNPDATHKTWSFFPEKKLINFNGISTTADGTINGQPVVVLKTPATYTPELQSHVIKYKPSIKVSEPYARIAPSDGRINSAVDYYYEHQPSQRFQLVSDTEPGNYSIHFKTNRGALTSDQTQGLVEKIVDDLPQGSSLATWGSVSKGGFSGLHRFQTAGMTPTGTRTLSFKNPSIAPEIAEKYGVTLNADGTVNWPIVTKMYR